MDTKIYYALIPFLILVGVINLFANKSKKKDKKEYSYNLKLNIMTPSEKIFFKKLSEAIGVEFYIFPQVHLNSLVDERVQGQTFLYALRHINQKSVDYILCDKETLDTKMAIELDDYTHDWKSRKPRDVEVERILAEAKLPLLRIRDIEKYDAPSLKKEIEAKLLPVSN